VLLRAYTSFQAKVLRLFVFVYLEFLHLRLKLIQLVVGVLICGKDDGQTIMRLRSFNYESALLAFSDETFAACSQMLFKL